VQNNENDKEMAVKLCHSSLPKANNLSGRCANFVELATTIERQLTLHY
jgi:hypothetical protein